MTPAHLLLFHHASAHDLIHCRFHKRGANPLAIAVALAVIGNEGAIAIDERVEFLHRTAGILTWHPMHVFHYQE